MSIERLNADIKTSMKNKQIDITMTLRGILSQAKDIAKADKNREVTDEDVITACTKSKKEAIEGLEIYKNLEGPVAEGNYLRNVRLEKLSSDYLPTQLTETEIVDKVNEIMKSLDIDSGMNNMGRIMGTFNSTNAKGTFDGAIVSKVVRAKLT